MREETIREKNQALVAAAADGQAEAVLACLERGANIHHEDDLALRAAVYLGHSEVVDLLLAKGANVHADKEGALFAAIQGRDQKIIDKLIEKGADAQIVLDTRKGELDAESLNIIDRIQTRSAKIASEKNLEAFREKTRKSGRPGLKPKLP